MKPIDLDDYTNGNWMANLRELKKCKTEAEREALIKKWDEIKLVEISMEEIDKALGEKK